MVRRVRTLLALSFLSLAVVACGEKAAEEAVQQATGHLFTDDSTGVAFDLPKVWAERYDRSDSISVAMDGLIREITLRFRRADQSVVAEPLMVVRVFAVKSWNALPPERRELLGSPVAGDGSRAVALRMAAANPLAPNTMDALGFDTLMIALNQRPFRAWLRPEGKK